MIIPCLHLMTPKVQTLSKLEQLLSPRFSSTAISSSNPKQKSLTDGNESKTANIKAFLEEDNKAEWVRLFDTTRHNKYELISDNLIVSNIAVFLAGPPTSDTIVTGTVFTGFFRALFGVCVLFEPRSLLPLFEISIWL
jgi:hypothetical protein